MQSKHRYCSAQRIHRANNREHGMHLLLNCQCEPLSVVLVLSLWCDNVLCLDVSPNTALKLAGVLSVSLSYDNFEHYLFVLSYLVKFRSRAKCWEMPESCCNWHASVEKSREVSWNVEAARLVKMMKSLWNVVGDLVASTAAEPPAKFQSDMRSLWPLLLTWFNFNPSMDK